MKLKELEEHLSNFEIRCLLSKGFFDYEKERYKKIKSHCRKASDFHEFLNNVFNDESLEMTQGYAELVKNHTLYPERRIAKILKKYATYELSGMSDIGGVLVGNNNLNVLVPNGYGDGETSIFVIDDNKFNDNFMRYLTVIEGEFNIYRYDCCRKREEDILTTLNGKYAVYYYNSIVAFAYLGERRK